MLAHFKLLQKVNYSPDGQGFGSDIIYFLCPTYYSTWGKWTSEVNCKPVQLCGLIVAHFETPNNVP